MYRTDKQLKEVTDDTRFERSEKPSGGWNLLRRMTIDAPSDHLYDFYADPRNLAEIYGHFATVEPVEADVTGWTVKLPMVPNLQWQSEIVHREPGKSLSWASKPGGSLETQGRISFAPAPAGQGTEVTLYVRYDPPAGPLGDLALSMATAAPKVISDKALRRFKSLVETGEIATTAGQPAGRSDGRDKK